jgi:CO/xanthine dehydrogenase Mo-binding subunit
MERSGAVTAITGSSPHGQGHETTFAQVVADHLGVEPDVVTVRHGDTAGAPQGSGTAGSRSTALGGGALALAARDVRAKGRRLAASVLEAAVEDVVAVAGGFHVVGAADRTVVWRVIAELAHRMGALPAGEEPGLEATRFFEARAGGLRGLRRRRGRETGVIIPSHRGGRRRRSSIRCWRTVSSRLARPGGSGWKRYVRRRRASAHRH